MSPSVLPGIPGVPAREAGRATVAAAVAALQRLHDGLGDDFEATVESLVRMEGTVLTCGVGKSGFAAQKVAATLRSAGAPAVYLSASDTLHGDLGVVRDGDLALLFSKSGATRELLEIVPHLRARGAGLVAITGSLHSPLALEADFVLDASVEDEGCPLGAAPMASALVAQSIGDALAAAVMRARGVSAADFARLHPAGSLGAGLTLRVADVMRRGRELPHVGAGVTLRDAIVEITRTGYGAVCVLDPDRRLCGLITDGDIRRALMSVETVLDLPVTKLMTAAPLTVAPSLLLSEALLELERRRKPYLVAPVVSDENRCVGLLRLHDLVRAHLPS